MRDYAGYLFDADGTLIDTAELIYRCFVRTCRHFAGIDIDRRAVISHIGLPLREQLQVYLGRLTNERSEVIAAYHMAYQLSIYRDHVCAFAGIPEALACLRSKGKKLAVVTSRMPQTLELYLEHTGIRRYFTEFVTPLSTSRHKPDPEPALKAAQLLGVVPSEALFVGDASFDIECGNRADMDTAFVAWSHTDPATLCTRPTWIIESAAELCGAAREACSRPHSDETA